MNAHLFYPNGTLNEQLLSSIPKKTYAWVQQLYPQYIMARDGNIDTAQEQFADLEIDASRGSFGRLSWSFDGDDQFIIIESANDAEETIMLSWVNEPNDPKFVGCTADFVTSLTDNLPQFIALEKRVYDHLELLARALEEAMIAIFKEQNGDIIAMQYDRNLSSSQTEAV